MLPGRGELVDGNLHPQLWVAEQIVFLTLECSASIYFIRRGSPGKRTFPIAFCSLLAVGEVLILIGGP